jgi:hypothetical protein
MSDRSREREYSYECSLLVRPRLRAWVAIDTQGEREGLEACSVAVEYDEDGVGGLPGPEGRPAGIAVRGVEFDVYRNGDRVLDQGLDASVSEALGYVDEFAARFSRRFD